jgi:hypothetical protein
MLAAQPPATLRINPNATLVPSRQHVEWLVKASALSGLTKFERSIIDAIAAHHRRACRGSAAKLSIESPAFDCGQAANRRVSAAIGRLIDLGWLAVWRGSRQRGSNGCSLSHFLSFDDSDASTFGAAIARRRTDSSVGAHGRTRQHLRLSSATR